MTTKRFTSPFESPRGFLLLTKLSVSPRFLQQLVLHLLADSHSLHKISDVFRFRTSTLRPFFTPTMHKYLSTPCQSGSFWRHFSTIFKTDTFQDVFQPLKSFSVNFYSYLGGTVNNVINSIHSNIFTSRNSFIASQPITI